MNSYDLDGDHERALGADRHPGDARRLTFRYYFAHSSNSSSADYFRAYVEREDGTRTLVRQELGAANNDNPAWARPASR